MAIEKDKGLLALKVIILAMSVGVLIIAVALAYFSMSFDSTNAGSPKSYTMIITGIPVVIMLIGSIMVKSFFLPLMESNKELGELEKYIGKRVAFLGMFEAAAFIGQAAIFIMHTPINNLPAWAYVNYIYILVFFFVAYKCWPRPEKKHVETFAGDLVEEVAGQENG